MTVSLVKLHKCNICVCVILDCLLVGGEDNTASPPKETLLMNSFGEHEY